MIIDLICIVDDGGETDRSLPSNARTAIRISRGADVTIRLSLFNRSGPPYRIASADVITFTAGKRSNPDADADISKVAALARADGPNRSNVTLVPGDTKDVQNRVLLYDIWLARDGTGTREPIMPTSPMYIDGAVKGP